VVQQSKILSGNWSPHMQLVLGEFKKVKVKNVLCIARSSLRT